MRQVQLKKTVKAREKQNVSVKAQTTYEDKNIQKQTAIKQIYKVKVRPSDGH